MAPKSAFFIASMFLTIKEEDKEIFANSFHCFHVCFGVDIEFSTDNTPDGGSWFQIAFRGKDLNLINDIVKAFELMLSILQVPRGEIDYTIELNK